MNRVMIFCTTNNVVKCELSVCPDHTCKMNLKQLLSWYERFGFKNNDPNLNIELEESVFMANFDFKIT